MSSSVKSAAIPPPQAVGAGFTNLIFDQEAGPWDIGFGVGGHRWNANLWWKNTPPANSYAVSGGILTITDTSPDGSGTDLCTQYHDLSGGTYFTGGYFEAYMLCTDWSAFWLFCADRPFVFGDKVLPSNPLTWTNEIDIIETDPGPAFANNATTTLHANSSGDGGVPDQQNPNNNNRVAGSPLLGQWHTYGCLWTQTQITWYVDNVQICTTPAYASTWQPVQLILTAAPKGVNGSPSTVTPPITQVQWVRVWQVPSPVPPAPASGPFFPKINPARVFQPFAKVWTPRTPDSSYDSFGGITPVAPTVIVNLATSGQAPENIAAAIGLNSALFLAGVASVSAQEGSGSSIALIQATYTHP